MQNAFFFGSYNIVIVSHGNKHSFIGLALNIPVKLDTLYDLIKIEAAVRPKIIACCYCSITLHIQLTNQINCTLKILLALDDQISEWY